MKAKRTRREIVARALCRFDGHPENITFEGKPMWMSYLPQADAVLAALDLYGRDRSDTGAAGTDE